MSCDCHYVEPVNYQDFFDTLVRMFISWHYIHGKKFEIEEKAESESSEEREIPKDRREEMLGEALSIASREE